NIAHNRYQGALGQPPVLDSNDIFNIIQEVVGQNPTRKINRPTYRKPYSKWIDRNYEFPRGFKIPEFSLFSGDGNQSTVEHIGR
ncbi:hypothetical protein, partial [Klebsiella pneumoniae]|uniref:hypothetical protein n=1 Tax=Klebsiella pneumoniae TaxID=573 RepID=UPI001BE0C7AA